MAGGWLPTNGEDMFRWMNQKIRILERHRHPQNFGEMPGSIDASDSSQTYPLDSYTEGLDDDYPIPAPPPPETPPPDTEDASPVDEGSGVILDSITGSSRAEIAGFSHTTSAGASTLVASSWTFDNNLYSSGGIGLEQHTTDADKITVTTAGWYLVYLRLTINIGSPPTLSDVILDWQNRPGDFAPYAENRSISSPSNFTLGSFVPIWLPTGGWISFVGAWNSTASPSSVTGVIDVTGLR